MREVSATTLYEQVAALAGLPAGELWDTGSLLRRLPTIQAELRARLLGQETAVDTILSALRARLLRNAADRPVLCLLAVGPSGVGKTETALQLARTCLGNPEAVVRLDMSEYMEPHAVSRLIGAPPGYVGHEAGGQLTEAVRRWPRSVVLFDEIEKADPEVLNVLLQITSAGRLTDGAGQTVDFRRTMIVLTSNLGNQRTGVLPERRSFERQVLEAVESQLRPELLGRLDGIVVYHHLSREAVEGIVRLQLSDLAESLHGVSAFEATPEAVRQLATEADSPNSGAREVGRTLKRRVDPAILRLLEQGLLDLRRPVPVRIRFEEGDFLFDRGRADSGPGSPS